MWPSDFLRDSRNLVRSRDSGEHRGPSILLEGPHSGSDRLSFEHGRISSRNDEMPHGVVNIQQFENSHTALIPCVIALLATCAFLQIDRFTQTGHVKAGFLEQCGGNLFRPRAVFAVYGYKTLRKDTNQ